MIVDGVKSGLIKMIASSVDRELAAVVVEISWLLCVAVMVGDADSGVLVMVLVVWSVLTTMVVAVTLNYSDYELRLSLVLPALETA